MTIAFCSVTLGMSESVGHLALWTGAMEAWPRKGEKHQVHTRANEDLEEN